MPLLHRTNVRLGALCAVLLAAAACSPQRAPPPTVDDLMHDRVALDGVLMKCGADPNSGGAACANARAAIERLAAQRDAANAAKREAEFERQRAALRHSQDQQEQKQEAAQKVDAYSLPLVPVEPASATPPPSSPAPPQ